MILPEERDSMCEACDNYDGTRLPRLDAELVAEARAIEAEVPGERASEEAWAVFVGRAGGGISWAEHKRMTSSYEAAEAAASASGARALGRRRARRPSSFRCDAASLSESL
jgi:hypothetical protein